MARFYLEVQRIDRTCLFRLAWGQGQQLTAQLPYPETLTTLYQTWKEAYLRFYNSGMRARVDQSGSGTLPPVDWGSRLAQAEATLLAELHLWLRSAELFEIRSEISGAASVVATAYVEVFLTCTPIEVARLPWETWQVGTEFAVMKPIRIVRQPANIRADRTQRSRQGKMRVLAILGDETGLNFQAERAALQQLSRSVEVEFVGWQAGKNSSPLKQQICTAIADSRGWDILFFAGHSNETDLTGGEIAIAPGQTLLIREITSHLSRAKTNGLQFALFNSCCGISIAEALIDLGLSQVAVMREPVHNRVAQAFLVRFLQAVGSYQDVHAALLEAGQYLKLERNLTDPSAYLIASLFRHPDSIPFQIAPFGWRQQLRRWLPTQREAIALSAALVLSGLPWVQSWLLDQRVWVQAIVRHYTTPPATQPAPVLLVQIDDRSIQKAGITNPSPMDRGYLAKLIQQLTALNANVIGVDYLLDRPSAQDARLKAEIQQAVTQNRTWFVFASLQNSAGQWLEVLPDLAAPTWSLSGDTWLPFWYVRPLPWSEAQRPALAYNLAVAGQIRQDKVSAPRFSPPKPDLGNSERLLSQVRSYADQVGAPLVTSSMRLQPLTAFPTALGSAGCNRFWISPCRLIRSTPRFPPGNCWKIPRLSSSPTVKLTCDRRSS